ncbi:PRKCA-binding protein [Biomphalaria pfeifferi]|uniref:PRKCA-binding protein n=1 Tax=Biomphalaria pfeifferi TaxID=112525 RepID=A0AAD8BGY0_BIOPF|nr:PRKCA-binding protein [Biomphalaria pfeifferi]
MRSDVLVKMELLDQKHVQDIVFQLQKFVTAMAKYHTDCHDVMKGAVVFPIEVDLSRGTFTYESANNFNDGGDDDEEEDDDEEMIGQHHPGAQGGVLTGDRLGD